MSFLSGGSRRRVWAAHVDHLIQSESIRRNFRASAADLAAVAGVLLDIVEADAALEADGGRHAAGPLSSVDGAVPQANRRFIPLVSNERK